jgi:hypothetical protein
MPIQPNASSNPSARSARLRRQRPRPPCYKTLPNATTSAKIPCGQLLKPLSRHPRKHTNNHAPIWAFLLTDCPSSFGAALRLETFAPPQLNRCRRVSLPILGEWPQATGN